MAAWWGAGEEILTTGSMELFNAFALDESEVLEGALSSEDLHDLSLSNLDVGLDTEEVLESFPGCLDPSILSILESSTASGETESRLTEESEATLLTALTEILDNVDDENLSPFDTLSDSELLAGHKEREQSPLRRFLSLARSPPEREPFSLRGHRTLSSSSSSSSSKVEAVGLDRPRGSVGKPREESSRTGKLRMIRFGGEARSDGEEEEEEGEASGSAQGSESEMDPASPEMVELAVSLPLEPGTDSMALCELVKHMHPYCLTVCLEGSEPELPEGGLVLEILGPGEQEETPVASPEPSPPAAVHADGPAESPQRRPPPGEGSTQGEALPAAPSSPAEAGLPAGEDEGKASEDRPRQEASEKRPSRRRKKRKDKEVSGGGGRALRSRAGKQDKEEGDSVNGGSVPPVNTSPPKAPREAEAPAEAAEGKIPQERASQPPQNVPEVSPEANVSSLPETPKNAERNPTDLLEKNPAKKPGLHEPSPAAAPEVKPGVPALGSDSHSPVPPVSHSPEVQGGGKTAAGGEGPSAPQPKEPKPRLLSLEEYRLLRQKKKPQPVEKPEDQRPKWPTLPELPRELPPIPCLPEPTPPGLRRASVDPAPSAMPAWQPIGPGAPPTPEALLVPPGSASAPIKPAPASKATARPAPEGAPNSSSLPKPAPVITTPRPPCALKVAAPDPGVQQSAARSGGPGPCNRAVPLQGSCRPAVTPGLGQQLKPAPAAGLPDKGSRLGPAVRALPTSPPEAREPLAQTTTETLKPQSNSVSPKSNSGAADPVARVGGPTKCPAPSPAPAFSLTSAAQGVPPSRPVPAAAAAVNPRLPARDKLPRAETCAPPVSAAARPAASRKPSPAEALIQAFTSEIGIEASDLTSLLEQFEETQAAVCSEPQPDGKSLERGLFLGLASSAGLTPPATPPHHPWKPVTPAAVVPGKPKPAEVPRPCNSKTIQIIDPRPLPRAKTRPKAPAAPAPEPVPAPTSQIPAFTDHDYCLPQTEPAGSDLGTRWNVKQLPVITIKPIERPSPPAPVSTKPPGVPVAPSPKKFISQPLDHRTQPAMGILSGSVMLSPESSPCRLEADIAPAEKSPSSRTFRYDESPASPPAEERGRARRRYRVRSPSSSSSSSDSDSQSSSESGSRSPPRKRRLPRRCYRHYSYSSSRSGSWSRSRSRSPSSPPRHWRSSSSRRRSHSPGYGQYNRYDSRDRICRQELKNQLKEKAIEERRVVYIGKIRGGMTRKELKERFSLFGEIEECTLHFREHGDNYGFVTYTHTHDAFTAIEKGNKLRNPDELPFDLCFGGRRQFCKTSYADLDSNREFDPGPAKSKFDALDFDTLLKQAQKGLRR
nr:PREDICTED: peroxisome proliferator-activated receptor gamma coactivator-related protein 1 [Lepisosteus oculatus]